MSSHEALFKKLTEIGSVGRGKSKHRPRNDPELYGGPYPFIQTGDVKHANFYVTEYTQSYSEKGLAQSKLWEPGTLCLTIAANIADTAILKISACFPDSIIGFVPKKDVCEVKFVKYCLDTYKKEMRSISQGTTQDNLSQEKLLSLRFRVPHYKQQKKIAAILSAYDDLIENNQRRIALLEKMADELYSEWFVRMRFPGHEKAKFEKGIPKEWEVKQFNDIVDYYIGGGWGEEAESATFSEGAYVIRGTDIPDFNQGIFDAPYRYHKPSNLQSRNLLAGDFVFEVSGGSKDQLLGRNVLLTQTAIDFLGGSVMCASFCKQIRFNADMVSPLLMKYFMKRFYESDLVGLYQIQSTGISNYQFEAFLKYQSFIVPSITLQRKFEEKVRPMIKLKDVLSLKNISLKKARDLLLPRLISGKLSVETLDIHFPPSMQDAA